jgi:hypothetical protein
MITWGLCANPAIVLDVSHWQGIDIDFATCRDLGVEGVIAKTWHGRSTVMSGQVQIDSARHYGVPTLGRYAWMLPDNDLDLQIGAWYLAREADELPLMIDFEEASTKLRGPALITRLEYVIAKVSDRIGCRPLLYTGQWYWAGYCGGLDSQLAAECPLVLAAYPRLGVTGLRYHDAVNAACEGTPPAVPRPWAERGIAPLGWQFDGDGGLYLPKGIDTDVNVFDATRLRDLRLGTSDTDPAPRREPGLMLGDDERRQALIDEGWKGNT